LRESYTFTGTLRGTNSGDGQASNNRRSEQGRHPIGWLHRCAWLPTPKQAV